MLGPGSIIIASSDLSTKRKEGTDPNGLSRLNIGAEAKRGGYLVIINKRDATVTF